MLDGRGGLGGWVGLLDTVGEWRFYSEECKVLVASRCFCEVLRVATLSRSLDVHRLHSLGILSAGKLRGQGEDSYL